MENPEQIPEQGQMVTVRNRYYIVNGVSAHTTTDGSEILHKLSLECLDDDLMGEELELIWEIEPEGNRCVIDAPEIPWPEDHNYDLFDVFEGFIHAVNWTKSSLLFDGQFLSPFRSAIMLKDYQLEPLARAINMPRANLLVADDVGLGKTIEAGLIIQEFLAQQRISRILIVCPASLQRQWQEEMEEKFSLHFEVIDRANIIRLRREYGIHMNPWNSYPRLITSMDFLKREMPLSLFQQSLKTSKKGFSLREWDLLIVDEAHNVAPSGKKNYIRDSDRTRMMRSLVDHFEHRLFLTATPHNGFTPSFTALLELLDPLKFSRGDHFEKKYLQNVMVRRLKTELTDELGSPLFHSRTVKPIVIKDIADSEQSLYDTLKKYTYSRVSNSQNNRRRFAVQFALSVLKKRMLSSPLAFARSICVHETGLKTVSEEDLDVSYLKRLQHQTLDEWSDDFEKNLKEETALQESSRFFTELTDDERRWLSFLSSKAEQSSEKIDAKAASLLDWIRTHLCIDGEWNEDRLVVFTEYKDTLEYLTMIMENLGWGDRIISLYGGMREGEREQVKQMFSSSPKKQPIRILLATDAASEGLNLQKYCRFLIHYEIPWNPNRMEQRNGRIDRVGQTRDVSVYHFLYENHEDSRYLQTVIDKVQQMRSDLGSIGDVISDQVERRMLGFSTDRELILEESLQKKLAVVREETKAQRMGREEMRRLRLLREKSGKELHLSEESLFLVFSQALQLLGGHIQPYSDSDDVPHAWRITKLPREWSNLSSHLLVQGKSAPLVFSHDHYNPEKSVLLHLHHPLMRKALFLYREHIWKNQASSLKIHRCSYKIVDNAVCSRLHLLVFGRLVISNPNGVKLHEDIVVVGGEVNEAQIETKDSDDLWSLFYSAGNYHEISKELSQKLNLWFPQHDKTIHEIFSSLEKDSKTHFKDILKKKADDEAKSLKDMLRERIEEITVRLHTLEAERLEVQTKITDWLEEEQEQFDEDERWLQRHREKLKEDLSNEPLRAAERYHLSHCRIYPLATLYVIPKRLLDSSGGERSV